MSKLVLKDQNGNETEVREIQGLDKSGFVILHLNCVLRKQDIEEIEKDISEKLKRNVVVLDSRFSEIMHTI